MIQTQNRQAETMGLQSKAFQLETTVKRVGRQRTSPPGKTV
jgi:hypothetical protein